MDTGLSDIQEALAEKVYLASLRGLSDAALEREAAGKCWLSGYAASWAEHPAHWQWQACEAECARRGKPAIAETSLGGGHRPEGAARAAAHHPRKRNGAASSCAGFEKRRRLLPWRLWLGWFAVHSGKRRILEDRSRRDGRSSNRTMERAPARQPAAGGVRARRRRGDLSSKKAEPMKPYKLKEPVQKLARRARR